MNRRDMMRQSLAAGAVLGLSQISGTFPLGYAKPVEKSKHKLLVFTRSQTFEHSCLKRKGEELSLLEKIMTDLGKDHGFEVNCTKDGRVFSKDEIAKYDAVFFQTTADF